jgi:hypothetical protein
MRHPVSGREAGRTLRRAALAGALALATWLSAGPAEAGYDPQKAGNPFRIVYYVAYPVAFTIDWVILRPAYYIGQVEPFHTIFGTKRHPRLPDPPPAPVPAP